MNKSLKTTLITIGLLFFLFLVLYGLGDALTPLIIAFGLSYLLFPLVKRLEAKGVKREFAVSGIFFLLFLCFSLSLILIIPSLMNDGKKFVSELPKNAHQALSRIENLAAVNGIELDLSSEGLKLFAVENMNEISGKIIQSFSKTLKTSFSGIVGFLTAVLNFFLIPLFFFYVINDYEKYTKEIKSYIPASFLPRLTHYSTLCNTVLSGYIRGQMMVALALGILYAVGLQIVGLKFGVLIGLISGMISLIPYAGFTLGFLMALVVALSHFSGVGVIIGVVAVFTIVQVLESFIITPKLVGDKVGLSAFVTMLALIIGGNLLGLPGMLLGIPLAAIMKAMVLDLKKEYQKTEFFQA